MPSMYKRIEDLPLPKDANVRLEEVPGYQMAVREFTWNASPDRCREEEKIVKEELELLNRASEMVKILDVNKAILMQYNPPWTIPFLRKNEVDVPVALFATKSDLLTRVLEQKSILQNISTNDTFQP